MKSFVLSALAVLVISPAAVCATTEQQLETRVDALDRRMHGAAERDKIYEKRIAELQHRIEFLMSETVELNRKVSGMQKQITVLHAKKANK